MAKCDCCGRERTAVYCVKIHGVNQCKGIWELAIDKLPNRWIFGFTTWACGPCECLLRQMASNGMFELTHVQACASNGDNRLIGSLEMW